jgi:hypothetical protein
MNDQIKKLFTEKLPEKMKEMNNDEFADDDQNRNVDSDDDNNTMWTFDRGLSKLPSAYADDENLDPIEDLYSKQNYLSEEGINIAAQVGVWELRLRCNDPNKLKKRNPLVGSEVVYQHQSQTLEIHEATTVQELEDGENWQDLENAVDKARKNQKEIMQQAQITVRRILWNRMILYHCALFLSIVSLRLLFHWDRQIWNPDDYKCKPNINKCCLNQNGDEVVQGGEIGQVMILYLVLGLLSAYKNGWHQSQHQSYETEETHDGVHDANLFGAIADDETRKGLHQKSVGSVLSRLLAFIIAATPMVGKYWRIVQEVECTAPPMSAFTGNSSAINFQGLAQWSVLDQLAVGCSLLGFVGVITCALVKVLPLFCVAFEFKQIYDFLILSIAFFSVVVGGIDDSLHVILIPCSIAYGSIKLWQNTRTMNRTDQQKTNLRFLNKVADRFVGFRFTKEYVEVLAVVVPPMIAIVITMCLGSFSTTAPKCTRLVVHWGCFALSFTLCRVWLDVMHDNYRYFERQTKLLELFTQASTATSWHGFKRNFIDRTNQITNLSPVLSKIRRALRLKEHYDLLVLVHLDNWNNTRDVLAKEWTSNETQVREANLQSATWLLLISVLLCFIRFFVQLPDQNAMSTEVKEIFKRQYEKDQLMTFMFVSLSVVTPMLLTRKKLGYLQTEHIKLLEKIQHRTNIIKVHRKLDSEMDSNDINTYNSNISSSDSINSNLSISSSNKRGNKRRTSSVGRRPKWKRVMGYYDSYGSSRDFASERRQLKQVESEDVDTYLQKIRQADSKPEIFPGYPIEDIWSNVAPIVFTMLSTILFSKCKCSFPAISSILLHRWYSTRSFTI